MKAVAMSGSMDAASVRDWRRVRTFVDERKVGRQWLAVGECVWMRRVVVEWWG